MNHISIVNKARGNNRAKNQILVDAINEEIEAIAKREAAKNKTDISGRNGLMRAIMHVMSRDNLVAEAVRLAKERLVKEGKIDKEDPSIVKHRGKIVP